MNRSRHSPDERRPLLESPTATSTSRYGSNAVAVSVESGGDSSTLETSSVDDADGGSLRPITFGSDEVSKSFFEKKALHSNLGYICHLSTLDNYCNPPFIMYRFHNKLSIQVIFDRFCKNTIFCCQRYMNPQPSCLGISFFKGISISLVDHIAPISSQYSVDLRAITKTLHMVSSNITLCKCFTYNLVLPGPPAWGQM